MKMKDKVLLTAWAVAMFGLCCFLAHSATEYGKTEFLGDVSVGSWTAVSNVAAATTTGGNYTNGNTNTFYYMVCYTNKAGRGPTSDVVSITFTGAVGTSAVSVTWQRKEGAWAYAINKSWDGSTWTNYVNLGAAYTNWTDTGLNTYTNSDFTNDFTTLIPAPTVPWTPSALVFTQFVAGTNVDITENAPTVRIDHADSSDQASVTNTGETVIFVVGLDSDGHVTSLASTNLAVVFLKLDGSSVMAGNLDVGGFSVVGIKNLTFDGQLSHRIDCNTADGSDTNMMLIAPAGLDANQQNRGAYIKLFGNEYPVAGYDGRLMLAAGDDPGNGYVDLLTSNNQVRVRVYRHGGVSLFDNPLTNVGALNYDYRWTAPSGSNLVTAATTINCSNEIFVAYSTNDVTITNVPSIQAPLGGGGQFLFIRNVGQYTIEIQDDSSLAGSLYVQGADLTIDPNEVAALVYCGCKSGWVMATPPANVNISPDASVLDVRNDSGADIPAGKLVYDAGRHSGSRILIALADGTDATKRPAIGWTFSQIQDGRNGQVLELGTLTGQDTSWIPATPTNLYLTTSGNYTNIEPATGYKQKVGRAENAHASQGLILAQMSRDDTAKNYDAGSLTGTMASAVSDTIDRLAAQVESLDLGGQLATNSGAPAKNGDLVTYEFSKNAANATNTYEPYDFNIWGTNTFPYNSAFVNPRDADRTLVTVKYWTTDGTSEIHVGEIYTNGLLSGSYRTNVVLSAATNYQATTSFLDGTWNSTNAMIVKFVGGSATTTVVNVQCRKD